MNTQYLKAEIMNLSKADLAEVKFAVDMREYQLNAETKRSFQLGDDVIFGRAKGGAQGEASASRGCGGGGPGGQRGGGGDADERRRRCPPPHLGRRLVGRRSGRREAHCGGSGG